MAAQKQNPVLIVAVIVFIVIAGLIGYMIWKKKEKYIGYVSKINPTYVPTPQDCKMCPFSCSQYCPNKNYSNEPATFANFFPNKAFVGGSKPNYDIQYADEAHRSCCPNDLSGCPSDKVAL